MRGLTAIVLLVGAGAFTGDSAPAPPVPTPLLPTSTASTAPPLETRQGLASYYWQGLDGKRTASGVAFDMDALVAAHPTYPFGTVVRVTNLENRRAVEVRIVDRGPVRAARARGVIIDLSRAAAEALDFVEDGRARVRVERLR